jgi:hypothetical protein
MFHAFFLGLNGGPSKRSRSDWSAAARPSGRSLLSSSPAAAFVGAFLSCLATSYLSALGFAPAIASALATTLLCGQVLVIQSTRRLPDELFTAIYGGAFGGMTSVLWFSNNASSPSFLQLSFLLTSLAVVCGLAFCIVAAFDGRTQRPLACGFGGRSGAIAAVACFAFVEIASLAGADDRLFRAARVDVFEAVPVPAALTFIACLMGTFAVLLPLRGRGLKSATSADRVFLSATIALVGLIGLRMSGLGNTAALDAFYAGCFLGLSTPERIKGRIDAALAAVVLTALLVQVKRLLPGIGGSLGLAAFLTVAVFVALSEIAIVLSKVFFNRQGVQPNSLRGEQASIDVRRFEPQRPAPVARRASIAFNVIFASVALGCFVLPMLLAPDGLMLSMANSKPVPADSAPIADPIVLSEAVPTPGDDASRSVVSQSIMASDEVDTDKAEPQLMAELKLADNSSLVPPSAIAQEETSQKDVRNDLDAATPPPAPAVAAPTPPAAPRDISTGADQSNDKMFKEFLQWRAARPTETPAPVQKPKKKRVYAAQVVGPVAAVAPLFSAQQREPRLHRSAASSGTAPAPSSSRPAGARNSAL